jgi:hypothetical protein
MTVYPSIAPNYWAEWGDPSSSWWAYLATAMYSIENNAGPIGNPATDPAAYRILPSTVNSAGYHVVSDLTPGEITVSGFHSWNGVADPEAPFDNEYGSRIHFGLHILGNGTQFKLANLWNDMNSNDPPWNVLGDNDGWFDTSAYSEYLVGIDYLGDGKGGLNGDLIYMAGESPWLEVDELIYVGVGNAYDANTQTGSNQEKLDCIKVYVEGYSGFNVSNKYCLYGDPDAGGVRTLITCDIPEPATALLFVVGLAAIVVVRRRRPDGKVGV